jgi:RNA polymerase sigma-70 factor (ECF subfamily)
MKRSASRFETKRIRELLLENEGSLLRYAETLTRNAEAAREVVQDAFLRLCEADPTSVEGHSREWLFTVVRNRAFDLFRKKRTETQMSALKTDTPEPAEDFPPKDAHAQLEQNEEQSAVLRAFSVLTPQSQEVLRLKFEQDLSYAEIARITGLSVSNVGFILHTGIQKLKSRLGTGGLK